MKGCQKDKVKVQKGTGLIKLDHLKLLRLFYKINIDWAWELRTNLLTHHPNNRWWWLRSHSLKNKKEYNQFSFQRRRRWRLRCLWKCSDQCKYFNPFLKKDQLETKSLYKLKLIIAITITSQGIRQPTQVWKKA